VPSSHRSSRFARGHHPWRTRGARTGRLTLVDVIPELAVVAVVVVATNVWVHLGSRATHLATGPLGALLLLGAGRAAGLSWSQLGLAPETLLEGLVVGSISAAAIGGALALALVVPFTRDAFLDTRYDVDTRTALRTALVEIPLSTVVFEETAFRGVIWGLLERDLGAAAATIGSSALFGVWQVLPALHLGRTSTALRGSGADVRRRRTLAVLGAVVGTALAGLVLAELRRRTGSLLAPALAHWAANGCAVVASSRAWARGRESSPSDEHGPC
jgi:uncharacterized protein